jgi:hypothetical protein
MTMHHIIEQVDAYLAVLHQAREILVNDGKRLPMTKITRHKGDVRTNSEEIQNSSGRPAGKIHDASRKVGAGGHRPSKKRVVSTTQPKTLSPIVSHSEPTATMSSNEGNLVGEIVKRVPARRRTSFSRFASSRPINPIKRDSLKPTTALSHPIRSNVVVISAEQLRFERERSVKPAVVRPRSPGSGATGRLAFEALFGR